MKSSRELTLEAAGFGYDVVVVGAGVNGAATAWDAALRGLRVLLVDKGDIGSGTTSWSSRMIHGGLKYLERYDVKLVRESLREREWLLRSAPHLVRPLRFLLPFYQQNAHSPWALRAGMVAYDVLSAGKSVDRFKLYSASGTLALAPGLSPDRLSGAATYYDAQVEFAERMCLEVALAAHAAGAQLLTYTKVVEILRSNGRTTGVVLRDQFDSARYVVPARAVVNTAGPWVDEVLDGLAPRQIGGTKGTHLVVERFPGAPADALYYEAQEDGRPMMIIPWRDRYLLGSTDIRFEGDLDTVSATEDEYEYILRETNRVIPAARLSTADVLYHYTGVRPLPYSGAGDVADITRRHTVVDHAPHTRGLFSLVGGKLTTFRQVGEHLTDDVCRYLGLRRRSLTRRLRLPGATDELDQLRAMLISSGFGRATSARLVDSYGVRAVEVAAMIGSEPRYQVTLDDQFGLTAGEVAWAIRSEHAVRLADVLARRTMIGLEADLGLGCAEKVAAVCQAELDWSDQRRDDELIWYENYVRRLLRDWEA